VTSPVSTGSQSSTYIYDADGSLLVQEDPLRRPGGVVGVVAG
jgi:hypothetical protein